MKLADWILANRCKIPLYAAEIDYNPDTREIMVRRSDKFGWDVLERLPEGTEMEGYRPTYTPRKPTVVLDSHSIVVEHDELYEELQITDKRDNGTTIKVVLVSNGLVITSEEGNLIPWSVLMQPAFRVVRKR